MELPPWDRKSVAVVVGLTAAKLVVHLALVNRYGYHGDELYFIECGRHLAWGYVDHAPLIPWIARAADELGEASLFALRLPSILAGAGTMAMSALLVREWGGAWRAQLVALLSILLAPAFLRMAVMLDIPSIEVFACAVASYLVARALRREERWTWFAIGVVLGLALLTKHTTLIWGAALAVGLIASDHRRVLLRPMPWLALALAVAMFVPNLIWQSQNDWATFEFSANLRRDLMVEQGRALFALGQILYFHPLVAAVWIAGITFGFTQAGREVRPFAVQFVVMFVMLLAMGGKPYYLASAYPALLAAGGVALERWLAERAWTRRVLVGAIATTGLALALLSLPIFALSTVDAAIGRILGWIVPPMALTHDMHGMLGWDAHVATVERTLASLPEDERAHATVLTGSYSQASALNVLRDRRAPRAISGHMTFYLWGPGRSRGEVLIAYGLPRDLLERHYASVEERDRVVAPDARPFDTDLPVYVCRRPRRSLRALWPELRQFDHRASGATGASAELRGPRG